MEIDHIHALNVGMGWIDIGRQKERQRYVGRWTKNITGQKEKNGNR